MQKLTILFASIIAFAALSSAALAEGGTPPSPTTTVTQPPAPTAGACQYVQAQSVVLVASLTDSALSGKVLKSSLDKLAAGSQASFMLTHETQVKLSQGDGHEPLLGAYSDVKVGNAVVVQGMACVTDAGIKGLNARIILVVPNTSTAPPIAPTPPTTDHPKPGTDYPTPPAGGDQHKPGDTTTTPSPDQPKPGDTTTTPNHPTTPACVNGVVKVDPHGVVLALTDGYVVIKAGDHRLYFQRNANTQVGDGVAVGKLVRVVGTRSCDAPNKLVAASVQVLPKPKSSDHPAPPANGDHPKQSGTDHPAPTVTTPNKK